MNILAPLAFALMTLIMGQAMPAGYTEIEMSLLAPILVTGLDGEVPAERSFYVSAPVPPSQDVEPFQ